MIVSDRVWQRYISNLAKINATATEKMRVFITKNPLESEEDLDKWVAYAFGLSAKYGEAAAALAAEMYDAMAEAEDVDIEPAEPAEPATYGDTAGTILGVLKVSLSLEELSSAVGRLVKRAGADTVMQNAIRDNAFYAFIPHNDTCAFCLSIAAEGWKKAYSNALKNGHAAHIHGNCDCMYAVKFNEQTQYRSYNPEEYVSIFDSVEGKTQEERINALRRQFYAENRTEILAQKKAAEEIRDEISEATKDFVEELVDTYGEEAEE